MQQIWSESGLSEHWSLGFEEHRAVQRCRTDSTKLGFAAQLRYCAIAGKFPYRRSDIPFQALSYIGDQLGLSPSSLKDYSLQSELASRHRREILDLLELRRASKPDWRKLESFLVERLWNNELNLSHLDSEAQNWFRRHHVLIPAPSSLNRCCERVRSKCLLELTPRCPAAVGRGCFRYLRH